MDLKQTPEDNFDVQKKVLTRWISSKLKISIVSNIYDEIKSGKLLQQLLKVLTGSDLNKPEGTGIELIDNLLQFVQEIHKVPFGIDVFTKWQVHLSEVSSADIVFGKQEAIHRLLWDIIFHWEIKLELQSLSKVIHIKEPEQVLLFWCQQSTQGYSNVNVLNFSTSWRDGLAFNALLHNYHQDWFSFDALLHKDNQSNLEHAFNLAHDRLGLIRLLDADDVNVDHPDAKCIMLYIASYFKVFSHQNINAFNWFFEDISKTNILPVSSESSLLSREISMELPGFMEAVEGVLLRLLGARDVLSNQQAIADDMDCLKEQFHSHEKFMMKLTKQQNAIGNILQEGSHLVAEGLLTEDEEKQVEHEMTLVNARWEELRLQAMERQTRLQQALKGKQQDQLDQFADWLKEMESYISTRNPIRSSEAILEQQISEHSNFHSQVKMQQNKVNGLQNMVLIVDETNSESAFAALEQQLESLGHRWSAICRWTEQRKVLLEGAAEKWNEFSGRMAAFTDWLVKMENLLSDIKKDTRGDSSDINNVVQQVRCLKIIENDMDEMMKSFDELNDLGLELVQYIDNNEDGIQCINSQLQGCQERWDNLVQHMEQLSNGLASSGVQMSISKGPNGVQSIKVSKKGEDPISFSLPKPTLPSPLAPRQHTGDPSRHKIEFDRQVAALSEWLDQTEVTQELVTGESCDPHDQLSLEEQTVLLEDAEKDVKSHEPQVEQLRNLGTLLMEELSAADEPMDSLADVIKRLDCRWRDINKLVRQNKLRVESCSKSQKFYDELRSVHDIVKSYEKWIRAEDQHMAEEFVDLSRQLEQSRVKQKALKSHENHVKRINEMGKELMLIEPLPPHVTKELTALNDSWVETVRRLSERQQVLSKVLHKTPPKSFLDALLEMLRWIDGIEHSLESTSFAINSFDAMERDIAVNKELQNELRERQGRLEYVNLTGQDLLNKTPADEKSQRLRTDLVKLNSRWNDLQSIVASRLTKLETGLSQLKQYKIQYYELQKWTDEMESFLVSEVSVLGDLDALQAQLTESNGVQEDIETMQSSVDSINEVVNIFLPKADKTFGHQLKSEQDEMNVKWKKLVDLSLKHNNKLVEDLERTRAVVVDTQKLDKWIDSITKEYLAREYTVRSEDELKDLIDKFVKLDEEAKTSKIPAMNQLKERVSELVRQAATEPAKDLDSSYERISLKFQDVCSQITINVTKFRTAKENLVSFTDLIKEEMNFLNQLEKILSSGSKSSADAEELSEEQDELENFLATRNEENRTRVNDLAQALMNSHVMVAMVNVDLDGYVNLHGTLMDDAKKRIEQLTEAVQQAQNRESQIVETSQWMTEMSELLQARLGADILAEDTPKEFESFKAEFDQHDLLLSDLAKEVILFKEQGKVEAADRLKQQLVILNKHFAEVTAKFCKFQRPVNFEPKLALVKHQLDELEEQSHILRITSLDPDFIQSNIDQSLYDCFSKEFYKTMSEIKPDVEYVIKIGRQVVEKKQVDSPQLLNGEIDKIKGLYNRLGSQVTRSKSEMDQCLKFAKKLKKDFASLAEFVSSTEQELIRQESTKHSKDIEEDLIWLKASLAEIMKRHPTIQAMSESVEILYNLADKATVKKLETNVLDFAKQLNDLAKKERDRKELLQAEEAELEKVYVEFETMQRELNIWLDNAEDSLNEISSESLEDKDGRQIQRLAEEHSQLMSQLDQVRESAVDIISKSKRYGKMVEPLLTLVNQRWQEVTNRLKNQQTLQREASLKLKKMNDRNTATAVHLNDQNRANAIHLNDADLKQMLADVDGELKRYEGEIKTQKMSKEVLIGQQADQKIKEMIDFEEEMNRMIKVLISHEQELKERNLLTSELVAKSTKTQVCWQKLKKQSERRRLGIVLSMEDFSKFRGEVEEFDQWLYSMEKTQHNHVIGDVIKTTKDTVASRQLQLSDLNKKAVQLPSTFACSKALELVTLQNFQMICLERRLDVLSSAVSKSPSNSFRRIQSKKFATVEDMSQYVADLECLSGILDDMEKEIKLPLFPDCSFDFSNTADEDNLESVAYALNTVVAYLQSAESIEDEMMKSASDSECKEIDNLLKKLRTRVDDLRGQINDRKRSDDESLEMTASQFTATLDDVTMWLNETENVINEQINSADKEQMSKYFENVKEKEDQLCEMQTKLRLLNKSGKFVYQEPSINRECIGRDLTAAIERWNKVVFVLPKKRLILEDKLHCLDSLLDEMDRLRSLILTVPLQSDSNCDASAPQPASINLQTIQQVLSTGWQDRENLKKHFEQLESDAKSSATIIPVDLESNVNKVLADWSNIESLSNNLSDQFPSASHEETFPVTAAQEIVCFAEATPLRSEAPSKAESLSMKEDQLFVEFSHMKTPSSELDVKFSQFHQLVLHALHETAGQKVVVGNIQEIETKSRCLKVKMAEIETSSQDLVASCEILQSDSTCSESDRRILNEAVERLQTCSAEAKSRLSKRNIELEDMLLECRQFEQMSFEFERWIISLEEENSVQRSTVGQTISALEELIEANKRLQVETLPWQERVNALHSMADKIIEQHQQDDSSKLLDNIQNVNQRWNNMLSKLSDQAKLLENSLNSIYRFDADLKDFCLWLTKVEIVLKHHEEMVNNDNTSADDDNRSRISQSSQDLCVEIDEHRSMLQSLNATGNQIVAGLPQNKAETLKNQIDDMNQRWDKLRSKNDELRRRIESQFNANSATAKSELLKRLDHLGNFLKLTDEEIGESLSLEGDIATMKIQLGYIEKFNSTLEEKQREVEENVALGRKFCQSRKKQPSDNGNELLNDEESLEAINSAIKLIEQRWRDINQKLSDRKNQITHWTNQLESFEAEIAEIEKLLMQKERAVFTWKPVKDVSGSNLIKEMNQIKTFEMEVDSIKTKIDAMCNSSSALLNDRRSNVLSKTILNRIDDISQRWSLIESSVEERLRRLTNELKAFGPDSEYGLSMVVFPPWERAVADNTKVPYYINHSTEKTQWDHPEMSSIQHALAELNVVKFSAYRTSMKMRLLQKRLFLHMVSLESVLDVFGQHNLKLYSEDPITVSEIVKILAVIFTSSPIEEAEHVNLSLSIDLVLNWLLNLFDPSRTGHMKSLSFKVVVIIMCDGHLDDKYKAIFQTIADEEGLVDQQRLAYLLLDTVQIPKQLGEIAAFGGSNIEPSVKSCFEKANNPELIGLSHFLDWMKLEPQSMVWLPVMHRLSAAESAVHQAKCNICKECPIIGFRYRCLKCFNFDMCQNCFFCGRKDKSHKLSHPMQEYCTTTTSGENMRDFTKMFKNKFRSKRYFKKHPRLGYLPVQTLLDTGTFERQSPTVIPLEATISPTSVSKSAQSDSRSSTPSSLSLGSQNAAEQQAQKNAEKMSLTLPSTANNGTTTTDMHSRLELYANRLAEVEQKRRESTPDWDDEHNLIAQYCQSLHGKNLMHSLQSPMQIMMAIDSEQRSELEAMIKELEDENRILQSEYDQLKQAQYEQQTKSPYDNVIDEIQRNGELSSESRDAEMIAEAKLLRQHKGRLEARMQILEDHNNQLDAQLRRLRELLAEQPDVEEMRIVTYPNWQMTASSSTAQQSSSLPRRGPPSFASAKRRHNCYSGNGNNEMLDEDEIHPQQQQQQHYVADVHCTTQEFQDAGGTYQTRGIKNIDNLFQVAEEVGRAVETLVNIMTDDERHAEEEKDLAKQQKQQT